MSENPYEAPKSAATPTKTKAPGERLLWPLVGLAVGATLVGSYADLFPFWKSAQSRITIGAVLGSMVGSAVEYLVKRKRDAATKR